MTPESIDFQNKIGETSPPLLSVFQAMVGKLQTLEKIVELADLSNSKICTTQLERGEVHTILDNEFTTVIKGYDDRGSKVDYRLNW